jgi:hypothetical protein
LRLLKDPRTTPSLLNTIRTEILEQIVKLNLPEETPQAIYLLAERGNTTILQTLRKNVMSPLPETGWTFDVCLKALQLLDKHTSDATNECDMY